MNLKNNIILGELDYVLTASFAEPNGKAIAYEYDSEALPIKRNENGATNINCLYVLNETLEKLTEIKRDMNGQLPDVCYIAIPKKLFGIIQRGTYKSWLKNDGVATTGTKFSEREMNEWARFSNLYGGLFSDVALKDATYYEMSNPRYDVANMKKHKYLIKQMKARINAHKEEELAMILG